MASFHKDIRSESRSYKRDKDTSAKWSNGVRPGAGVVTNWYDDELTAGSESQKETIRPHKAWSQKGHAPKIHSNTRNANNFDYHNKASGRISKKTDAIHEISSSPPTLSKSLLELLPNSTNAKNTARSPTVDVGITYSFDQPAGPRKLVGLDGLVEKAEQEWKSRETDNILKKEYEVVDESGETTVLAQGKKGKKSPKQKPMAVAAISTVEDEDDWERI